MRNASWGAEWKEHWAAFACPSKEFEPGYYAVEILAPNDPFRRRVTLNVNEVRQLILAMQAWLGQLADAKPKIVEMEHP